MRRIVGESSTIRMCDMARRASSRLYRDGLRDTLGCREEIALSHHNCSALKAELRAHSGADSQPPALASVVRFFASYS